MQALYARYTKPRMYDVKYAPDALWEFKVQTDEKCPHGYNGFGGLLRRVPDGDRYVWQARHYGHTEWAASASGRLAAIDKLIPIACEKIQQSVDKKKSIEQEWDTRMQQASDLQNMFMCSVSEREVFVADQSLVRRGEPITDPSRYSVTVVFKNLSRSQVQRLAVTAALSAGTGEFGETR